MFGVSMKVVLRVEASVFGVSRQVVLRHLCLVSLGRWY